MRSTRTSSSESKSKKSLSRFRGFELEGVFSYISTCLQIANLLTVDDFLSLPGIALPENVVAVPDVLEAVKGATYLIFVLPHQCTCFLSLVFDPGWWANHPTFLSSALCLRFRIGDDDVSLGKDDRTAQRPHPTGYERVDSDQGTLPTLLFLASPFPLLSLSSSRSSLVLIAHIHSYSPHCEGRRREERQDPDLRRLDRKGIGNQL
jgi:hypothetical protein